MHTNDQLDDGAVAVAATQTLVLCVGNAHELFSTIIRSVGTGAIVLVTPDAQTAAEVLRGGVASAVPDGVGSGVGLGVGSGAGSGLGVGAGAGSGVPDPAEPTFGGLRLSKPSRVATWRGRALQLSERQFDLLVALAGDPGRVWTFAELTENVWQRRYVGDDDAVASAVKRLRRAVAEVTPELAIESVRGVGYRLALLTTPLAPRQRRHRAAR